ncbi:MAG: ATP-dependent helicase [Terriglobales bacterium]
MESLLADLNPRQAEAVETTEGALLVLAGAGSGKTRVITRRIAHLVRQRRAPAPAILAMTFTNKAAAEMSQRVSALLGGGERPVVSTFHSFCVRVLRASYDAIGGPRNFTIYADDEQLALIKSLLKQLGLDDKRFTPRSVLAKISHAKNHGWDARQMLEESSDPKTERVAAVYDRYQHALRQAQALDFDDLLLETERLLRQSTAVAERLNERFHYIHVDEYQDTNRPQYHLLRLLTRRGNVCVVGDEDQSIYSWRGADLRNILDFERDFPAAKVVRLEQNYRSTRNILDAASAVVANNLERKGKTLWTESGAGVRIGHYAAADGEEEALWVANEIRRYLAAAPEGHAAVLYRTNAQSRPFEEALRRNNIPYRLVGGFSFYERAEVKDLLAYLKAAVHLEDSISLLRIINTPPRGIGRASLDAIEQAALSRGGALWAGLEAVAAAGASVGLTPRAAAAAAEFHALMLELAARAAGGATARDLLAAVLERTGYARLYAQEDTPEAQARVENMDELLNAAADSAERGETLLEFLDHAALISDQDDFDAAAQVTLMSLHAAKGLEFPLVFLAGLEDGLFPHSRAAASPRELEEERRLCYVGMTRARERLVLSRARFRRRYGGGSLEATVASRFLREVPAALLEDLSPRAAAAPLPAREEDVPAHPAGHVYVADGFDQSLPGWSTARRTAAAGRPQTGPAAGPGGLKLGARVRHARFGAGTVLRIEGEGVDRKLTVSFPGYGLKKMVERFAGLEPVR